MKSSNRSTDRLTRGHNCRPLWIAGRGAIATCTTHWNQLVGPNPTPMPAGGPR